MVLVYIQAPVGPFVGNLDNYHMHPLVQADIEDDGVTIIDITSYIYEADGEPLSVLHPSCAC